MSENLVPTVATRATPQEIYAALQAAWQEYQGTTPTRASLLVLLSQWSLETGGGGASMCWNMAGIKHVPGDGHDYATYLTTEYANGVKQTLEQKFRAYPTLLDGVRDWMHVLLTTFGFAWSAVLAGDTADFAHKLRARGYFTAPEADYARGLGSRYAQLDAVIPKEPSLANVLAQVRAERDANGPDGGDAPRDVG